MATHMYSIDLSQIPLDASCETVQSTIALEYLPKSLAHLDESEKKQIEQDLKKSGKIDSIADLTAAELNVPLNGFGLFLGFQDPTSKEIWIWGQSKTNGTLSTALGGNIKNLKKTLFESMVDLVQEKSVGLLGIIKKEGNLYLTGLDAEALPMYLTKEAVFTSKFAGKGDSYTYMNVMGLVPITALQYQALVEVTQRLTNMAEILNPISALCYSSKQKLLGDTRKGIAALPFETVWSQEDIIQQRKTIAATAEKWADAKSSDFPRYFSRLFLSESPEAFKAYARDLFCSDESSPVDYPTGFHTELVSWMQSFVKIADEKAFWEQEKMLQEKAIPRVGQFTAYGLYALHHIQQLEAKETTEIRDAQGKNPVNKLLNRDVCTSSRLHAFEAFAETYPIPTETAKKGGATAYFLWKTPADCKDKETSKPRSKSPAHP